MAAERKTSLSEPLEVLTVGLPFCVFKVAAGSWLLSFGPVASGAGRFLIALGIADAGLNLVNLAGLLVAGRRLLGTCVLSSALSRLLRPSRRPAWSVQDMGISLDVLLSFSLVALMVGSGRLRELPGTMLTSWNVAVVFNVLGAGLGRFTESFRRLAD